ncbi:NlpC/P60 family protein [Beijerinckia indica]|uniref:NLP/P60 protein n=1 Tax=Beijerinckia indica subsp. indica (strain ATCC 9039 / DSM 1715 / NCIMB 8712) TaxID=395963 RepID=B2IBH7_BEII9|nr:NlpC/P60 family protein [Beijerinckia indica]ACB96603.1 NLP/P60 protein [Beijerinckia indica subsp. indica ATCC 9039]
MHQFDPRLTPARTDLAAEYLRGRVTADTFAPGRPMRIGAGLAALHRAPRPDSPIETHALHGEKVTLYEDREGWGWVQLGDDSYVGYLAMTALAEGTIAPTHRVCVNRTFIYPEPDMKHPPIGALPLGARVVVSGERGAFLALATAGFVFAAHLVPQAQHEEDFVAVAERLLHVPYLWGGKSSLGIDCSGLVQLALAQTGVAAPRDTDLQQQNLGTQLDLDDPLGPLSPSFLRRGDLIFWKGHVGIMRDATELLHANGHHMQVVSEPLAKARARILEKSYGPITAIRRL